MVDIDSKLVSASEVVNSHRSMVEFGDGFIELDGVRHVVSSVVMHLLVDAISANQQLVKELGEVKSILFRGEIMRGVT